MSVLEIIDLVRSDPDSLKERFPAGHPERETIDIAVAWSEDDCPGCLTQVAELIKLSLEKQYAEGTFTSMS